MEQLRKILNVLISTIIIFTITSCGKIKSSKDEISAVENKERNYDLCQKFKGMSLPSWNKTEYLSEKFTKALNDLKTIGINSVAIIPTIYQEGISSSEIVETEQTASDESISFAIEQAKKSGFCVMLKPHIDPIPLTYRGLINPKNIEKWKENYFKFILKYAKIAEEKKVEIFAIGTELEYLSSSNPEIFSELADKVREIFSGKIIYAANFTEYKKVEFWEKLDFIGIDAYFSMCESPPPRMDEIEKRWTNIMNEIIEFANQIKKETIFTEIGYISKKGTCQRPWDWTFETEIDEDEQAILYEAAIKFAFPKLRGMFWWEWEFYGEDQGGFTPRGKKAQQILSKMWGE
jgi:hypothetical protein